MNKFLHKQADTLDVIRNIDPTEAATAAALTGLAGYLYSRASQQQESNYLRDLLYTGGGALTGAGIYSALAAATANRNKELPEISDYISPWSAIATTGSTIGGYIGGRKLADWLANRPLNKLRKNVNSLEESLKYAPKNKRGNYLDPTDPRVVELAQAKQDLAAATRKGRRRPGRWTGVLGALAAGALGYGLTHGRGWASLDQ